jgi:hypothetical protein
MAIKKNFNTADIGLCKGGSGGGAMGAIAPPPKI